MAVYSYPYPSYSWQYQGLDYWGMSGISQQLANDMYSDGVRFVGRYLYADKYPNGKGITAQEAQFYLNAGIRIFFFYEVNESDALGGYQRGRENGLACLQEALDLNVPDGTQIYCCCDTGVTDTQANGVVMQYLDGFREALSTYNTGIYGGQNVVTACYNTYPNNYRCQAGAMGFQEFAPINVRQWMISYNRQAQADGYIGIQNVVIDSDGYATWRGHSVDLLSADSLANMWGSSPVPPTPTGDDSMPLWFYLKLF